MGGTTGVAAVLASSALLSALAFAFDAGVELLERKICTTTWLITRCTGQYKLTSHSASKCANITASQTSRRGRDAGYCA
jgi:hypothetical protein